VSFDQVTPLGELTIRWTGSDEGEIAVSDEFDEEHKPTDESGEAPQVEEDPDFLEPGPTHTDPADPAPEESETTDQ
jgi:segregation and condensation protein A